MKINGGPEKILGVYNKQGIQPSRADRADEVKGTKGLDRIELSTKAQDFRVALKALGEVPDVREAKVAQLKARINSGQYNVDAEEVADSIIDGLFLDKKV
ncbi:MAG: flagellar biosynthesis anti-sigma factor FlgM [Bacillota bacterium]|nr:flagellar biosynthesis anti-sigma factor FlgM [Bacillota bacterium]MDD3297984.1 flagellar biosynthesis anti-sigma factor FlgM [Bacillota bacterium]MDD3851481.1 flagellar biosynthesis anti-sigma factor FlgM [Bacillota bacterium]MDD4707762.1 flagellar biosynthesis anti-sigma factor FlgM [Bacillota bacterium]